MLLARMRLAFICLAQPLDTLNWILISSGEGLKRKWTQDLSRGHRNFNQFILFPMELT